jgi:hypothetical protein
MKAELKVGSIAATRAGAKLRCSRELLMFVAEGESVRKSEIEGESAQQFEALLVSKNCQNTEG